MKLPAVFRVLPSIRGSMFGGERFVLKGTAPLRLLLGTVYMSRKHLECLFVHSVSWESVLTMKYAFLQAHDACWLVEFCLGQTESSGMTSNPPP